MATKYGSLTVIVEGREASREGNTHIVCTSLYIVLTMITSVFPYGIIVKQLGAIIFVPNCTCDGRTQLLKQCRLCGTLLDIS